LVNHPATRSKHTKQYDMQIKVQSISSDPTQQLAEFAGQRQVRCGLLPQRTHKLGVAWSSCFPAETRWDKQQSKHRQQMEPDQILRKEQLLRRE